MPHPPPVSEHRFAGSAVWAIDLEHLPNYLVHRDCPHVTYACDATTTAADRLLSMGQCQARHIIAIQTDWLARAQATPLYLYEVPLATFSCIDRHAGHHISREVVTPRAVRRVDNPIAEMLTHDVELRIVCDRAPLARAVAASTLSFSCTRLRNL